MQDDLLDIKEACRFIGGTRPINPATLWRGVKAKRYPAPVRMGPNTVRWRRVELEAYRDGAIAKRDGEGEMNAGG
jgi:predicted DNA-binding transcriptional regulator AlpA